MKIQKKNPNNNGGPNIIGPRQAWGLLNFCRNKAETDRIDGRSTWVRRHLLIHLALATGLRVSEISNLRVRDIDLTFSEPHLAIDHPRRGRVVYLDSRLIAHFHRFMLWKTNNLDRAVEKGDFILQNPQGEKYTDRALEYSFKKGIKEAGLASAYSIHSARHSYAAFLLALTRDLRLVMRQMGHSTQRITSAYFDVLPPGELPFVEKILHVPSDWKA